MTDHHVLVGVDDSEGARRALRWALDEGALRDRPVEILAAWSYLDQTQLTGQGFLPSFDATAAASALHELVHDERRRHAGAETIERVVCDLPANALIEASADAELLVVGARGLGGVRGVLLGSVSDQCVRHSRCPVAVIRDEPAPSARNEIVVGIDDSEHAVEALRWALAEAGRRGASVRAVRCWELPIVPGIGWSAGSMDFDVFEEAAQQALDDSLQAVADDLDGSVKVVPEVMHGHPGMTLLDTADEAVMLVVGARGTGGFAGLLLGSTTTYCLHHGHGPVVVVR